MTSSTPSELLPCPMCGSDAHVEGVKYFWVICSCSSQQIAAVMPDGTLAKNVYEAFDRGAASKSFKCAARQQGTAGGNDPAECDWPICGCDPHADKVIAALQESGLLKEPSPPPEGDWQEVKQHPAWRSGKDDDVPEGGATPSELANIAQTILSGPWYSDQDALQKAVASVLRECMRARRALTATPPDTQWISVKERLPRHDYETSVIVSNNVHTEIMTVARLHMLVEAGKRDGDGCFWTHWAPLPPNPNQETGGGG